jgi:hypothetical protein
MLVLRKSTSPYAKLEAAFVFHVLQARDLLLCQGLEHLRPANGLFLRKELAKLLDLLLFVFYDSIALDTVYDLMQLIFFNIISRDVRGASNRASFLGNVLLLYFYPGVSGLELLVLEIGAPILRGVGGLKVTKYRLAF